MSLLPQDYLQELGIINWQLKHTPKLPTNPNVSIDWEALKNQVATCTRCRLHSTRTQTVFGIGNPKADLMLVGEAPGFNEDKQGEPFVGRAGKLLNAMLNAIELNRSTIFTANILKCRPPNNRDPEVGEVQSCTPYLDQQIAYIKPRLLVAVGRISAHYLLQTKSSLSALRGKIHHYGPHAIPLIATYHPAYLLRNPIDKKKAYSDLQFIQQTLCELATNPKAAFA